MKEGRKTSEIESETPNEGQGVGEGADERVGEDGPKSPTSNGETSNQEATTSEGKAKEGTERRRSTRVRKETSPLDAKLMSPPSELPPKKNGRTGTKYRLHRNPRLTYKVSGLVDKDWTVVERERLVDAVSKVDATDYASMAAIIGPTKTEAEIKDYITRIRHRMRDRGVGDDAAPNALFRDKYHSNSPHLYVDDSGDPIVRWIRVVDHLVSDNETPDFSKAIAGVMSVIANFEQNQDFSSMNATPSADDGAAAPQDSVGDEDDKSVTQINFKLIYEYLFALLRGCEPPELDPIEAWVVLDLISDTASELKCSDIEEQKEFLRSIYRDYCLKAYNLKWSNTSSMGVSDAELNRARRTRSAAERTFADYMGKGALRSEEREAEEKEEEEEERGRSPRKKRRKSETRDKATSSSSGDAAGSKSSDSFQHVMIGGLKFASEAVDLGSLFTLNPLGIPFSLLKPKEKEDDDDD